MDGAAAVTAFFDRATRRDGVAFAELFTADAVMAFPFAGLRYEGRDAIRERAVGAWKISQFVVREFTDVTVVATETSACAEYTVRGTLHDREHAVRGVLRLELRDGAIAEMREYFEPAALAAIRAADAGSPRELLRRFHAAMQAKSADALADLYAPDGIHEFAFYTPNRPRELVGREAIRASYRAGWANHPLDIHAIADVFVYEATDPEVAIGQWRASATLRATSAPVELTGLISLRARAGQIVHVRDFMDGLGVAHALGRAPFTG